jgi:Protein of unknown function (DUF1580)
MPDELLANEEPRPLADLLALFPAAAAVDAKTLARWASRGVRGHRLAARRIGAKWYSTAAAVERFLDVLNGAEVACVA